jgi:uncharacterized RDD family membrane protein YckC
MSQANLPAPGASGVPGPPAGLGRRAGAIAIDWTASVLLSLLIFRGATYGSPESSFGILGIFALEVIVLTWLTTASFGQRIVGICVLTVYGGRLALWQVALRTVLICLVIPAVVYDSDGRGLHDRIVGSRVFRKS